jgi:hypothetical protein
MGPQLKKGERVVRLASDWSYAVAAGTVGVIVGVYECETDAGAYVVQWEGREDPMFAAGSRLRRETAGVSPVSVANSDHSSSV